jgi:hypothetical protein
MREPYVRSRYGYKDRVDRPHLERVDGDYVTYLCADNYAGNMD